MVRMLERLKKPSQEAVHSNEVAQIMSENMRILRNILFIRRGRDVSVTRAEEWLDVKDSVLSPRENRNKVLRGIEDENRRLYDRLTGANSSVDITFNN